MRYNFDAHENRCFSFNTARSRFNIFRLCRIGEWYTWSIWDKGVQMSKMWEMRMISVQGPKGGYRF